MEYGSCWKDLEATSMCLRDRKALEASRGACGWTKPASLLGLLLSLAVWPWVSYSTSQGSDFQVHGINGNGT